MFARYSTGVISAVAAATTMAAAAALSRLLPLVLLAAVIGRHGASGDGGFPIVFYETKCTTPAPTWSPENDSAFRANVLALLGGLPSAAAPTGFASLCSSRSGGAGGGCNRDRAFAPGICFGDPPALSPQYCLRCLSVAAKKTADGCPANRRAAVWTDGCFLAFADTNASSPDEAVYRYKIVVGALGDDDESSVRFAGTLAAMAERLAPRAAAAANASRMLATATEDVPRVGGNKSSATMGQVQVHALAQCMPDRPAASCARCVQESARELAKCCWNMQGGVATVIGYNCHLRLDVSVPITPSVVEPQPIPASPVTVRTGGETMGGKRTKVTIILLYDKNLSILSINSCRQYDRTRHRGCDCIRHSVARPGHFSSLFNDRRLEQELHSFCQGRRSITASCSCTRRCCCCEGSADRGNSERRSEVSCPSSIYRLARNLATALAINFLGAICVM